MRTSADRRAGPGSRFRRASAALRRVVGGGVLSLTVTAGLGLPHGSEAKTFRYAAGPKAPEDTIHAVAEQELEPIVRKRGPRVPATNLEVVGLVANTVFDRALESAPLEKGSQVLLAPSGDHPLNFVIEHALLRALSQRGVTTLVRHSVIPDDSLLAAAENPNDPVLEYHLASARVTYLRLRGWLPGRVKIEREALVEGQLTLRDPKTSSVLWIGDAKYNLVDAFPRAQVSMVEDARFTDLKSPVPDRNFEKISEPVVVVAVVAGLVALFFQNRP